MVELTPEQKAALDKETSATIAAVADKQKGEEIAKVKETAKAEARKEFELEAKLKEQDDAMKKVIAEAEASKKENEAHLAALQKKFEDAMAQKRAPVTSDDPFAASNTKDNFLKSLTQEKIEQIEEQSARAFYGEELYNEIQKKR